MKSSIAQEIKKVRESREFLLIDEIQKTEESKRTLAQSKDPLSNPSSTVNILQTSDALSPKSSNRIMGLFKDQSVNFDASKMIAEIDI